MRVIATLSTESLMECLKDSAAAEYNNEYFGPEPEYSLEDVEKELARRLKEVPLRAGPRTVVLALTSSAAVLDELATVLVPSLGTLVPDLRKLAKVNREVAVDIKLDHPEAFE